MRVYRCFPRVCDWGFDTHLHGSPTRASESDADGGSPGGHRERQILENFFAIFVPKLELKKAYRRGIDDVQQRALNDSSIQVANLNDTFWNSIDAGGRSSSRTSSSDRCND